MKKIISLLLVLVVATTILAGCGKKKEEDSNTVTSTTEPVTTTTTEEKPEVKVEDVRQAVLDKLEELGGSHSAGVNIDLTDNSEDANLQLESLNLDPAILEGGFYLGSMMNINADTIIVLKVKDAKDIDKAKEVLDTKRENMDNMWKMYLPAQYEKVVASEVKTSGNYAYFVVFGVMDDTAETEEFLYTEKDINAVIENIIK